ncbi:sensor histidine kinase [Mumia sp. zg.B53]|uniref:sensor histidine kinase n=1 Tax=unclassified Mumia TaxID=2621872 RepID=UPI001C6DE093|nr:MULTISPECIES: sensor histidine kinase [unclassified Mumia]MBW9207350.1 sensor histidine kinase [Mumia sp. zg.B17]MBW9210302.1 sensor histidine kinase [Mumia sp. zg.B21]MBW9214912.1 sensor histidine kinase [Mumia sp. zg.B53]
MAETWGCQARRYAAVLVWVPLLAGVPLFALHGGSAQVLGQIAILSTVAAASVATVLTGRVAALVVLGVATVVASTQGEGWMTPWTLLAITAPVVLRGWPLAVTVVAAAAGSATAMWRVDDVGETFWIGVAGVLLAGGATTAYLRLLEANAALRCTRAELARVAVAEERERFSRDLHDLLGHTLSVMVVKAQAVRRLAERDPAAAAVHAADIERIGRDALVDVRRAVDAMRAPRLSEELEGARHALYAAGIRSEVVPFGGELPEPVDETLAWVVREGATNVIRHSGATQATFALTGVDGEVELTVADDGVGGPLEVSRRDGGLEGLRRRVAAVGGLLTYEPADEGFRLVARVPVT